MGLAEAIHDLWEANTALNAALPVARVFTGRIPAGTPMPYARLEFPASAGRGRGTQSRFTDRQIRVHLWTAAEDFATGEAIQTAVEDALADQDFSAGDAGEVLDVHHDNSNSEQEDEATNKAWHFVIQFTARTSRARAQ
jgi:hypothetical protein